MENTYKRFIQLTTGEYIDTEYLIEFGVTAQLERAIIWCKDRLGDVHQLDIIDKEWINEYPDYIESAHSDKVGSALYKEIARSELKRIMHNILDIDIV